VWNKRFDQNEKLLIKDVKEYFNKQEQEVLKNLSDEFKGLKSAEYQYKAVEDIVFDKKKAVGGAISLITPHIRKFLKEGGEMAESYVDSGLNMNDPNVIKFIQDRAKFFGESINDTTAEKLVTQINELVKEGAGFSEIENAVKNIYKEAEDYRTFMITRTEVGASLNKGALETYKQAGIEKKEWLTVEDGEVCEQCLALDGDIVDIEKSFSSGDDQPPVHPNCRCSVIAVVTI
jgi:SPP1 gp7 family putative phage head morphogenesis protein